MDRGQILPVGAGGLTANAMDDPVAIDTKVYDALISGARLLGIWMTESRFDMNPQALDAGALMSHSLRTLPAEVTVEPGGTISGFIRFEAVSRHKRRRVIHATARYFVSYRIGDALDEATARLFVDRVGRLAAYPYFRALVSSLVAQAGAQVPTLPILTVSPHHVRSKDPEAVRPLTRT